MAGVEALKMTGGIILLAHGSSDPAWRQPVQAIAQRVNARAPEMAVRCAYLEHDHPNLRAAADELLMLGVDRVAIVPLFLGIGRHVREDVPILVEELRSIHPTASWTLQPPVGEHPGLLDLLAQIALEGFF